MILPTDCLQKKPLFKGQEASGLPERRAEMNLLMRLKGMSFELLAPASEHVGSAFGGVDVQAAYHARRLEQIKRLRVQFGKWYTSDESNASPLLDTIDKRDHDSWHILGITPVNGEVVGAIRVRLYDMRKAVPTACDIMSYNDVKIADVNQRKVFENALDGFVFDQGQRGDFFHQIGGFVVSPSHRSSGLAPVLALAMNAWGWQFNLQEGCTFATIGRGVAAFHMKFGASQFTLNGEVLPDFFCEHHQSESKLLTTGPDRFDPRLKKTLDAIHDRFSQMIVVTNR